MVSKSGKEDISDVGRKNQRDSNEGNPLSHLLAARLLPPHVFRGGL